MSAFGNRAKFCEKTRDLAANFVEFRCTAHAELGWRAPRALHNMHGVATVLGEVSAAFGGEIARVGVSKSRKFSRENARTCCKFCSISGAVRMQNSAGACGVRCATRTVSAKLSGESALRLVTRLRDVGVRNRAIFREKTLG